MVRMRAPRSTTLSASAADAESRIDAPARRRLVLRRSLCMVLVLPTSPLAKVQPGSAGSRRSYRDSRFAALPQYARFEPAVEGHREDQDQADDDALRVGGDVVELQP